MVEVFVVPDVGMLSTIASIISAMGGAMLVFRIQRELEMSRAGEITWIPRCDWLLISATEIALLLVILPILLISHSSRWMALPAAGCASASVLMAGYIPAILAHYRLIFSGEREGPRTNPEPSERWVVLATAAGAIIVALVVVGNMN